MPEVDPGQRDDPVESGALEDDAGGERPPTTDDPVESGPLEDEET